MLKGTVAISGLIVGVDAMIVGELLLELDTVSVADGVSAPAKHPARLMTKQIEISMLMNLVRNISFTKSRPNN